MELDFSAIKVNELLHTTDNVWGLTLRFCVGLLLARLIKNMEEVNPTYFVMRTALD